MVGFPSRSRARRHPEPSPHFTQKNNIGRRWPRSVIFLQKRILPRNARITPLNCSGLCSGAKWLTPCRRINSPPGILRTRYSNRAFNVTGPLCVHSNCGKSSGRATDSTSIGFMISGSSFRGVFIRALIGQAFMRSAGKGTRISSPASPDNQAS